MKSIKPYVTGILAAVSLVLACITSHAQPTNFMAYNFDADQVTSIWGNWFGGDFVSTAWDLNNDGSNNASSGALELTVNYNSGQYVCWDSATPTYSPLPISGIETFTNLSYDLRYYTATAPAVRTNADGSLRDFGQARIGTRNNSYAQDWYFYYTVPATNSLGGPNTNWIRMSVDLTGLPSAQPDLVPPTGSGIVDTIFGQDDNAFGDNILHGTQVLWFDNIRYIGFIAPIPPPTMGIQKVTPGLDLFGGLGQYGRSELQISTNFLNDGWIGAGTTYPVKYSFTLANNGPAGGLDSHLTFLPGGIDTPEGNSGADYQQANTLWLQMVSSGDITATDTTCVCNFSWKTNCTQGNNPNAPETNVAGQYKGGVVLWFTNSVRAGTWTVEFDSDITGKIIPPGTNSYGVNPIPFSLASPSNNAPAGNIVAPATTAAEMDTNFANPMYVRFGDMNYGNTAHANVYDQWNNISVSGTAGTNFTIDFTHQAYNTNSSPSGVDGNLWDVTSSDGNGTVTLQVPTNAQYWVTWNTPDIGYNNLETATNLTGPWHEAEYYNAYGDGTNNYYILPTQTTHGATRWNLMLPGYLPTANGLTNPPAGNALSPNAYFRLTTNAPAL